MNPSSQQTPEDFETINWIAYLLRVGLGLDQKHVATYNQLIPIPPDDKLFVAVGLLDGKPFAGSLSYAPGVAADGVTPLLLERQTLNTREVFSIHFMSFGNEARDRRAEFTFALTNTFAQQVQARRGFLIGKLPVGLVDASVNEGAGRLTRYTMTLAVLSSAEVERPVEYFENFEGSPELITQQ